MRYPEFLQKNQTIGFVAPSFGCTIEPYYSAFKNAQKTFHNKGYRTLTGSNCDKDDGIGISTKPELCGKEINDFYTRKDCQVLISCGGGELMCEDVPYIDFDLLSKSKPKWFMGFSDNTNLTFLLATLCDTAAIYGPNAPVYGMEPWHPAVEDAFALLTGTKTTFHDYDKWERESKKDEEHPFEPYNVTEPVIVKRFPDEDAHIEGRLIGGCMDCLRTLLGTEFDHVGEFLEKYKGDGFIWFLESCDLNVMDMSRCIWQMKHAGWFKYVKGFLIGRPFHFGEEMMGLDQYEAITHILKEVNVPIIMDINIGHLPPMIPVVCGAKASVEIKKTGIEISYTFE